MLEKTATSATETKPFFSSWQNTLNQKSEPHWRCCCSSEPSDRYERRDIAQVRLWKAGVRRAVVAGFYFCNLMLFPFALVLTVFSFSTFEQFSTFEHGYKLERRDAS